MKELLKKGADSNCKRKARNERDYLFSALHLAAKNNDPKITQILIKFGANINCVNDRTYLNSNDSEDEYGAFRVSCCTFWDHTYKTPLHLAIINNKIENACILLLNNARIDLPEEEYYFRKSLCKSKEMKKILRY